MDGLPSDPIWIRCAVCGELIAPDQVRLGEWAHSEDSYIVKGLSVVDTADHRAVPDLIDVLFPEGEAS